MEYITQAEGAREARGAALLLDGIGKQFGANVVLRRVGLDVRPGEFVAIVGKSGSGKSTLLRLIAGLDAPSSGRLWLDDRQQRGASAITRVMFQEARLLPWKSVADNVRLGLARQQQAQADWALEQVGLKDRGRDWPAILSGGQRQRVALARALAGRPRLLLLDEPLGALDALTRLEMQQLIENIWRQQGFTTLLVTHDVEEAVALADRVIVLEAGEIALDCAIDLPRPRLRTGAGFVRLREMILARLLNASTLALAADVSFGLPSDTFSDTPSDTLSGTPSNMPPDAQMQHQHQAAMEATALTSASAS